MAETFANKLAGITGDLLDFGCGKSLVMKHYLAINDKANIHLFDVSADYVDFWRAFLPEQRYACFSAPDTWHGKFKVITSFFSMEHVADPVSELRKMRALLSPEGLLYICVPDMYSENAADMLVVDHVQHYSTLSMSFLLARAGFRIVEVDRAAHRQAAIYVACQSDGVLQSQLDAEEVSRIVSDCDGISAYWKAVTESLRQFELEAGRRNVERYYIVGAGILGTFFYLELNDPGKVVGFIDSNRFKQEKGWQNLPVIGPGRPVGGGPACFILGLNAWQLASVVATVLPPDARPENVWTVNSLGGAVPESRGPDV